MPPTTNLAYINVRGRGRVLSSEARAFKDAASWAAYKARKGSDWKYVKGTRLSLSLELHFARGGKRDLSNRVKLLEDALAEALGFDDSAIDRLEIVRASSSAAKEFCTVKLEPFPAEQQNSEQLMLKPEVV